MREEGIVVVKEEKKSFLGKLFRLAMFAVAVYGAVTAAKKAMTRLSRRLEEENEGSEKKRFLTFLNGRTVSLADETVAEIEMNTVASGVELDLSETELSGDEEICVRALLSAVVIKVPPMVCVEVDDTNIISGFMNLVPNYEQDILPVIHIKVQSLLSCVKIEMQTE